VGHRDRRALRHPLELERLHREAYTTLGLPLDEPEEHERVENPPPATLERPGLIQDAGVRF
jgi:hypothetical protein